jgi:hypothetical protein
VDVHPKRLHRPDVDGPKSVHRTAMFHVHRVRNPLERDFWGTVEDLLLPIQEREKRKKERVPLVRFRSAKRSRLCVVLDVPRNSLNTKRRKKKDLVPIVF